jgi:hypothetical protein
MNKGKTSILVAVLLLGAGVRPTLANDRSAIFINLASKGNPAQATLVITDPQGRRAGKNVITNAQFHEIPGESFGFESIGNDETGALASNETMALEVHGPVPGRYSLTVYSSTAALVFLDVSADDLNGGSVSFNNKPIHEEGLFVSVGQTQSFALDYTPAAGAGGVICKEVTFAQLRLSLQTVFHLGEIGDAKFVAKLDKILAEGEKSLSKKNGKDEAVEKLRAVITELERSGTAGKDKHSKSKQQKEDKRFVTEQALASLRGDALALIAQFEPHQHRDNDKKDDDHGGGREHDR